MAGSGGMSGPGSGIGGQGCGSGGVGGRCGRSGFGGVGGLGGVGVGGVGVGVGGLGGCGVGVGSDGSGRGSGLGSEAAPVRPDGARAGEVCGVYSIKPGYPARHRSCARCPPTGRPGRPRRMAAADSGNPAGGMDTMIEPRVMSSGTVTPQPDPERPANPEEEPVFPGPEPIGPDPDRPVHTEPEPGPSLPPPPGFDPEAPDPAAIPEPPEPEPKPLAP